MDNCFTGRRDRSRQTPEKDVLYIVQAGGLSTGGTVGGTGSGLYRLPVGAVPVKKPLQWLPVITPF